MFESQPNYLKGVLWWKCCNQTCPFVCNIKMNLFAAEDRPLQNRHIFGNDLLFPGFGSSLRLLHWHARAWLTAARVRCVVALTSQCSKLKAIKGVPFAPCKDPSKVPKSPILRSFLPITIVSLLVRIMEEQWFIFYTVFQSAVLEGVLLWNDQQTHPAGMTQLPNLPELEVVHYISRFILELPFEILLSSQVKAQW